MQQVIVFSWPFRCTGGNKGTNSSERLTLGDVTGRQRADMHVGFKAQVLSGKHSTWLDEQGCVSLKSFSEHLFERAIHPNEYLILLLVHIRLVEYDKKPQSHHFE